MQANDSNSPHHQPLFIFDFENPLSMLNERDPRDIFWAPLPLSTHPLPTQLTSYIYLLIIHSSYHT